MAFGIEGSEHATIHRGLVGGLLAALTGLGTACQVEPWDALECLHTDDQLSVDSNSWKLVPGESQERVFVVSGKNKRTGAALEALSVDIEIQPSTTPAAKSISETRPADFASLTAEPGSVCDVLSSQLLRCLLDLDGTTAFKLTAAPAVEFRPFTVAVTANCPQNAGTKTIEIGSDWREYSLDLVLSGEQVLNAGSSLCKDSLSERCAAVHRGRPVELRLLDAAGLPVTQVVQATITWNLYTGGADKGAANLSTRSDCSDRTSTITFASEMKGGELAVSPTFYVCADGSATSVELGGKVMLPQQPDAADAAATSDTEKQQIEVAAAPQTIAFASYLAQAQQFDAAEVVDNDTRSFRVLLSDCDGNPRVGERVTFTSMDLKFNLSDSTSWVSNELGLVTVFADFVGEPPAMGDPVESYTVMVQAVDGRTCDLEIPLQ